MKKEFVLFVIFLCFIAIKAEIEDCSTFEFSKQTVCQTLSSVSKICYYDNGCKEWYEDCGDYTPKSESDVTCSKITPKTNSDYKKCAIQKNGNSLTCASVYKECKELTSDQCTSFSNTNLNLGSDRRCVFFNGQCELHYTSCTNTEIKNSQVCNNNIPNQNTKRCKWNSNSCQEENRKCSDYITYSANGESSLQCHQLEHTSPKICFLDNDDYKCKEVYKTCEEYKSEDQTITCGNIMPLIETYSGFGNYVKDNTHYCALESSDCKTKEKSCEDYKSGDGESLCTSLKSKKDPNNVKARCILDDNGLCKDEYLSCEYYNDLVTEGDRKSGDCTAITAKSPIDFIGDAHYKCSFNDDNDKRCKTKIKACSEITDEYTCNHHILDDSKLKCIYKDGCKQEFKNCDIYDSYHSGDRTQISKTECEAITPVYDYPDNDKIYKCTYKEVSSVKHCEKEIINCEDYTGQDKDYCSSIIANDTSLYKCALVDNHCVTQYKDCYTYNNQIHNHNKQLFKSLCETIVLNSDTHRCFVKNDKICEQDKKLCSEYEGESEYTCVNSHRASETGKVCAFENNKCVEKYPTQKYLYCSDYHGTDVNFCESIQPYVYSSSYPDYSARCVYGSKGCEKVSKKCEEAKDYSECVSITPSNTNKICVFTNRCFEQYKDCETYEDNEDTLDQTICESILIQGYFLLNKCKFTPGTGNNKGTCRQEQRKCEDFSVDSMGSICSGITLSDDEKKCTYSNNACSIASKTCFDLRNSLIADKETCEAAPTSSSNRRCILNPKGNGCVDVDQRFIDGMIKYIQDFFIRGMIVYIFN